MEEAAPFIRGDSRELESLINRMKTLKGLYPAKRLRSFPFGDSINTGLPSLPRLSFLPPRYLVEQLVDNYLHTFERSYPLLDSAGFKRELSSFWNQPDAIEDGWLALLYMVLALSCYASPSIWFLEVPGGYLGLAKRCIDGAEAAFLMRGMFMTKPDLTSLRVLCLLSIGKLLDIITLDDSDGSWVFMGFVMRVGMSMCLHIGPASFPTMPAKEAVARRRIWNTLMLLDSTTALDSGMPLLLRPEDYDSTAFLRSNCRLSEEIPADRLVDENYQNLLADAAPIVAFIINKANSTSPRFGRNQILEYDDKIRHLLRKVEGCITSQRTVLEVLLHRCILAIHQSCSLNPGVGHCDEVDHCRRILHDSALGLLQLQSSLHDDPSHHWLSGLFVRDFGVAGLYVCDGLRNNTFLDTLKGQHSKYSAFSALKRLQTILKANLHHSRHYYKMYKAYAALISGLEALAAGSSIRDALYKAGLDIIAAVEECMGPRAEDDSSNLATLVDPLLQLDPIVNANFDFDGIDFVSAPKLSLLALIHANIF